MLMLKRLFSLSGLIILSLVMTRTKKYIHQAKAEKNLASIIIITKDKTNANPIHIACFPNRSDKSNIETDGSSNDAE